MNLALALSLSNFNIFGYNNNCKCVIHYRHKCQNCRIGRSIGDVYERIKLTYHETSNEKNVASINLIKWIRNVYLKVTHSIFLTKIILLDIFKLFQTKSTL